VELFELGMIDRLPQLTVVQAKGAAPFAHLFARHEDDLLNEETPLDFASVDHPETLASAIKIGAPVSWQKAWRALRWTNGRVLTVSEQEIADAKAIIGRDGIGCEPASATTVAGIKRLVESDLIRQTESVVAVLTGHLLKDTDYVIKYHSETLFAEEDGETEGDRIIGTYSNHPVRVEATKDAILAALPG
jgi:threonine synthase